MWVIATAGHVDHGKSTLVRALTGMEPDRWAEERRRGMTIDLGYAWTALDPEHLQEKLAFVDVPGHQKFVTNMLAGVGPVPAVMLVIAADAGWSRQTSEHLDAIDALGIGYGLVAVTRADLATPEQVATVGQDAIDRAARTSLGAVEAVAVSGATGTGLPELRSALRRLVERLPTPRTEGRVRLFIDRAFSVTGAGTVVTGTLGAGRITVGDQFELNDHRYTVRGLQQLGEPVERAEAVARVAVNLRGIDRPEISRGDCLITPDTWRFADEIDVEFAPLLAEPVGEQVLHLGSASIPVRVRPLGETTARLQLTHAIPVQAGDRGVLRDPAQQSVTAGVLVLDADPPSLRHRGAAAARAAELGSGQATGLAAQVRRRGAVTKNRLRSLGIPLDEAANVVDVGGWLVDPGTWASWMNALYRVVDQHAADEPQQPWITADAARRAVGLPDAVLLSRLLADAGLQTEAGRLGRPEVRSSFGRAEQAIALISTRLAADPFDAPERHDLAELGLTTRDLAAAEKAGLVLRLAPDLAVAPDAVARAKALLQELPQPFTASQARQALATTRRIALPLLEHLDRQGVTVRVDASLRTIGD